MQQDDPSVHGETDAFRNAGRRSTYRDTVMVTTLAPCWFCSGLVRQFGIPRVVVGESVNFQSGEGWPAENGVPLRRARMAATPALFRHVLAMTGLLAAPRLLQQTYE